MLWFGITAYTLIGLVLGGYTVAHIGSKYDDPIDIGIGTLLIGAIWPLLILIPVTWAIGVVAKWAVHGR